MQYDEFIDTLSARVGALEPASRASIFWLAGSGLRAGLSALESADWTEWLGEASELSVEFIVDGLIGNRLREVWDGAASVPIRSDATQLLNSSIVCLSSPLAIAIDPSRNAGPWIEHAIFPSVQAVSLDLFDDVAFPDDEDLDRVFADNRISAACDYLVSTCARLEQGPPHTLATLEGLLRGSGVLLGRPEAP